MIDRQSLPAHQQTPVCGVCSRTFLVLLGSRNDHLLACDCFTHGPGLLLIFLRLTFLFFSILKLAQQPTNTKHDLCSRHLMAWWMGAILVS